ncbi:MAG: PTS transporter subunit IIC [Oscillospiraceae bacterium]
MSVLSFLLEVIKTPAIILGLVALIGLVFQKKSVGQVFAGTVKTSLGMLVVSAGAGLIVQAILPVVRLFQVVFNLDGFATGSEVISAAMQEAVPIIAGTSSIIMAIGFLVNLLLARFTPLKYHLPHRSLVLISSGNEKLQRELVSDLCSKSDKVVAFECKKTQVSFSCPKTITLPDCVDDNLSALFMLYCIQLITFKHAINLNVNPDKPEGLDAWIKL